MHTDTVGPAAETPVGGAGGPAAETPLGGAGEPAAEASVGGAGKPAAPMTGGQVAYSIGREILRSVATAYVAGYLGLLVWSVLPMVAGWTPAVIVSGSMMPNIAPGDVVFYAPEDPNTIKPGRVILVDNPANPGHLLSHRLHDRNADRTLITKGDANPSPDSTVVKPSAVRGAARLIIPVVGRVTLWQGPHRKQAVIWTVITAVALILARNPRGEPEATDPDEVADPEEAVDPDEVVDEASADEREVHSDVDILGR